MATPKKKVVDPYPVHTSKRTEHGREITSTRKNSAGHDVYTTATTKAPLLGGGRAVSRSTRYRRVDAPRTSGTETTRSWVESKPTANLPQARTNNTATSRKATRPPTKKSSRGPR